MKQYSIGDICTIAANNLNDPAFRSRVMDSVLPGIAVPPIMFLIVDDLWTLHVALLWVPMILAFFMHEVVAFDQGMPGFYERLKSGMGVIWVVYDSSIQFHTVLRLVALEAVVIGMGALVAANVNGDWALFKEMSFVLVASLITGALIKQIPVLLRKKYPELVGASRRAM